MNPFTYIQEAKSYNVLQKGRWRRGVGMISSLLVLCDGTTGLR